MGSRFRTAWYMSGHTGTQQHSQLVGRREGGSMSMSWEGVGRELGGSGGRTLNEMAVKGWWLLVRA